MSPFVKESRLLQSSLKKAFPQASKKAIKKARLAAAYGATPKTIAAIMVEDAKRNSTTLEVVK
jgi:hypothetical protein